MISFVPFVCSHSRLYVVIILNFLRSILDIIIKVFWMSSSIIGFFNDSELNALPFLKTSSVFSLMIPSHIVRVSKSIINFGIHSISIEHLVAVASCTSGPNELKQLRFLVLLYFFYSMILQILKFVLKRCFDDKV